MKNLRKGDKVVIQFRKIGTNELHEPFEALITEIKDNVWSAFFTDDGDELKIKTIYYTRIDTGKPSLCSEKYIIKVLPQIAGNAPELITGNQRS